MNKKFLLLLVVLVLCIAMMGGMALAVTTELECDDHTNTYPPDYEGIIDDCVISGTQIINTQIFVSSPPYPPATWKFNHLTLNDDAVLWFVNSETSWADSGDDGKQGSGSLQGKGGDGGEYYNSGGKGGDGEIAGGNDGGGGGAGGGAGGEKFYQGGYGADGGNSWGCPLIGSCGGADGGSKGMPGLPGANVVLVVYDTLTFGEDSSISVSGQEVASSCSGGGESNYGGGGGGSGAGGSGAGELTLYVDQIINGDATQDYGNITAIGGNGGNGCLGGPDGAQDDEGGGGGAGGGAGDGGDVTIYYFETVGDFDNIYVDAGSPGSGAAGGDGAPSGGDGDPGQDGNNNNPTVSEETNCINFMDDDLDSFKDFQDKDCWEIANPVWDSVNGPVTVADFGNELGKTTLPGKSWWSGVALDGTDGVCGDDLLYSCDNSEFQINYVCENSIIIFGLNNPNMSECLEACSDKNIYSCCEFNERGAGNVCKVGTGMVYDSYNYNYATDCEIADGGDYAFVTDDNRYFCNQDYGADPLNRIVPGAWPYENLNPEWSWWDAKSLGNAFKYHTFSGTDFVSNSEEWYYCDASTSQPDYGAIPIIEGGTFDSATENGKIMCLETINAVDWFASHFGEPFHICDENNPYDYNCCAKTQPPDSHFASYSPGNTEGFEESLKSGECGTLCRVNVNGIDSLGNYLNNPAIYYDEIVDQYCDLYPQAPLCADGYEVLPGFGQFITGEVDSSNCGPYLEGCLFGAINLSMNCLDIQNYVPPNETQTYKGNLCKKEQKYCASPGEYIFTNDTRQDNPNNDSVCCLAPTDYQGIVCKDLGEVITPLSCEEMGGDYMPPDQVGDYVCVPSNYVIDDSCCLGGVWQPSWDALAFDQLSKPESTICYNHNEKSYLSECCTDFSVCANYEQSAMYRQTNAKDNGFFGKGGVLHTVLNFDSYETVDTRSNVVNKIKIEKIEDGISELRLEPGYGLSIYESLRDNTDWSTFKYLEFDIAFNQRQSLFLNLSNGTSAVTYNVYNFLVNGKSSLRWHKAIIPLNTSNFTFESVLDMTFFTSYDNDNFYIAVDNFFLSGNANGGENTENYYCTGNFGSWVPNLDGLTNNYFTSDDDIDDYGAYWYACEAQPSYDWTGLHCCGDDTKESYLTAGNNGEYFSDERAGCYHGVTVRPGETVAEALNDMDSDYRNIIFYDKKFRACMDVDLPKVTTYDGTTLEDPLILTNDQKMPEFTIIGDKICMNNQWINYDNFPRERFLVSKMYSLSFDDDEPRNFDMFCDSLYPSSDLYLEDYNFMMPLAPDMISTFCSLRYSDSDEDRILLGMALDKSTEVNQTLEMIGRHLMSVNLLESENLMAFANACDDAVYGGEEFFATCPIGSIADVGVKHNPDFNLLFIGQYKDPYEEFGGYFSDEGTIGDYIAHIWDQFIGLFTNWFGGGSIGGYEVNWTSETLLPLHEDAWEEYGVNLAKFNKLLLKQEDNKRILGIVEDRESPDGGVDEYVVVMFDNFNTSVKRIGDNYFSDNKYSLDYVIGNNRQVLHYHNPLTKGINLEGATKSFEPGFDWRTLGAALRFNGTPYGSPYTQTPGNSVVELGEYCDYDQNDQEKVFFRFNNNLCEFWNPEYENGTVCCNLSDNTLIYSECGQEENTLCPQGMTVLLDYEICDNEADDDGDGLTDCDDPGCSNNPVCETQQTGCEDLEQFKICHLNVGDSVFLGTNVSSEECIGLCESGDYTCCEYRAGSYKNCYGAYNTPSSTSTNTIYAASCSS